MTKTRSECNERDIKARSEFAWHQIFLDGFEQSGRVDKACKLAGISRTTAYRHRQSDEDFALAWHDIEEAVTDAMEREAWRRSTEGVDKPIFYRGEQIATVKEFSDPLMMFMLRARNPAKYREQFDFKHSGRVEVPTGPDLSKLSLDEARELQSLLEKATPEC
jgi:hypothetical protein